MGTPHGHKSVPIPCPCGYGTCGYPYPWVKLPSLPVYLVKPTSPDPHFPPCSILLPVPWQVRVSAAAAVPSRRHVLRRQRPSSPPSPFPPRPRIDGRVHCLRRAAVAVSEDPPSSASPSPRGAAPSLQRNRVGTKRIGAIFIRSGRR
jgi:hypothetical protein